MSSNLRVDAFVEDVAYEQLLLPLIARLASLERRQVRVSVRSARGGHESALEEMHRVAAGQTPLPSLFVVGIDGNCRTANTKRKEVRERSRPEFTDRLVIACADPHVERWYMADPDAFHKVVGTRPDVPKDKCERDFYAQQLASAVNEAGHPNTLGGIEWASELVAAMDLYRAAKNDPALGTFLDDLRAAIRSAP